MGTKRNFLVISVALMAVPLAANAALISTDGGLGVYDTTNNVTWTSNANLMATQAAGFSGGTAAFVSAVIADSGGVIHDTPNEFDTVPDSGTYTLSSSDFNTSNGAMTWWGAQAWVHYLDVTDYGGSNHWALPTTVDAQSSNGNPNGESENPSQSSSQLAELFYGGLGQVAGSSITTTHNGNYSLFSNIQSFTYWSGTEYSAGPAVAWSLSTSTGQQGTNGKFYVLDALAVSPGQVTAVPLPGAAWLMVSGIGGLGAMIRKRKAA